MIELELIGVSEGPMHPVVLLRHEDRVLPIVVGVHEANAIQVALMEEKIGRPMTHDLVCNLLAGLRGHLESMTIYKLENDTFYAHLNVQQQTQDGSIEQVLRVDSRPSDGIAIAVRIGCPIMASSEVMDMAAQDISILNPGEGDNDGDFEP